MRHRKRRLIVDKPGVDLERHIHGGHDFTQLPDHEDEDYTYVCELCGCKVSGWELDNAVWPARVGRFCMAILMGVKS